MNLSEIVHKKANGIELTMEERIEYLEFIVNRLINHEQTEEIKKGPPYKVLNVYYVNDYEYKGITFHRYMTQLEGYPDLFIMDKLHTTKDMVEKDDLIHCRIEGDKLKEVKVLYNV